MITEPNFSHVKVGQIVAMRRSVLVWDSVKICVLVLKKEFVSRGGLSLLSLLVLIVGSNKIIRRTIYSEKDINAIEL